MKNVKSSAFKVAGAALAFATPIINSRPAAAFVPGKALNNDYDDSGVRHPDCIFWLDEATHLPIIGVVNGKRGAYLAKPCRSLPDMPIVATSHKGSRVLHIKTVDKGIECDMNESPGSLEVTLDEDSCHFPGRLSRRDRENASRRPQIQGYNGKATATYGYASN